MSIFSTRGTAWLAAAVALVAGAACAPRGPAQSADPLRSPDSAALARAAPDSFRLEFTTTRGAFTAMARRQWAPHGVDRLYYLAEHHYYDSTYFFRVIENFVAQFGISGTPAIAEAWRGRRIPDDSVRRSNTRGTIAFASEGPNSRSVQLFINLKDNPKLDSIMGGFPPVAEVTSGMNVVGSLYDGYGEGAPSGLGPRQERIGSEGNAYLARYFPQLDRILQLRVAQEWR